MPISSERSKIAFALTLFLVVASCQAMVAQDVIHSVSGVVKHLDRGAKTIVVKTDDGVEHTVKWTDKTAWEGTKKSGEGVKEGSKVAVKFTENVGEKTAVGIKDIGKDTAKAVQ